MPAITICDPVAAPSSSASAVAASAVAPPSFSSSSKPKSPVRKVSVVRRPPLPAGVYVKAGQASQALAAMSSDSSSDESSSSGSSFHPRPVTPQARRYSPRKPLPVRVRVTVPVARPLTRSSNRTPAVTPTVPRPATKVTPSVLVNGSKADSTAGMPSVGTETKLPNGLKKPEGATTSHSSPLANGKSLTNGSKFPTTFTVQPQSSFSKAPLTNGTASLPPKPKTMMTIDVVVPQPKVAVDTHSSQKTKTACPSPIREGQKVQQNGCSHSALSSCLDRPSTSSKSSSTSLVRQTVVVLVPTPAPVPAPVASTKSPTAAGVSNGKVSPGGLLPTESASPEQRKLIATDTKTLTKACPKPPKVKALTASAAVGEERILNHIPAPLPTNGATASTREVLIRQSRPVSTGRDRARTGSVLAARGMEKRPRKPPTLTGLPYQPTLIPSSNLTPPKEAEAGGASVEVKEAVLLTIVPPVLRHSRLRSSTPRGNIPPPLEVGLTGLSNGDTVDSRTSVRGQKRELSGSVTSRSSTPRRALSRRTAGTPVTVPIAEISVRNGCDPVAEEIKPEVSLTVRQPSPSVLPASNTVSCSTSQERDPDLVVSSTGRSTSKFEQIWKSKTRATINPLSVSPERPIPDADRIPSPVCQVSITGRKRKQPRERFSPDSYPSQRSKSIRSPTSPKAAGKKGWVDLEGTAGDGQGTSSMNGALTARERRQEAKMQRLAAIRLSRKTAAQRRRRILAAQRALEAAQQLEEDVKESVQVKKAPERLAGERPPKRRRKKLLAPEDGNEHLIDQIASAAHLNGSSSGVHSQGAPPVWTDASLFSPEPSVQDSSSARGSKKPRTLSVSLAGVRPTPAGLFHGQHPLIPSSSKRTMVEDTVLTDPAGALPTTLPEKSLLTILTSSSLLSTQCSVVHARWRYISQARLLVRKSLTYNMTARHLKLPDSYLNRSSATKKRNLECFVQQLWQRQEAPTEKPVKMTYLHPVDVEIMTFTLQRPSDHSPPGQASLTARSGKNEVDLQLAVMKKNPKETLVKDLLPPILAGAVKLHGTSVGGKPVIFEQKNKVRLENFSAADFLVVNMETTKAPAKVVAFNIGDIKDGLALEVAGHYSFRVVIKKAPPAGPAKVDYRYVMIYASGQHYQVRDMVYLKHNYKGHSCVLCGMRCDSLCTLLRHIDCLHPSMGHEYDEDSKRLYVWFAPEHEFVRANVPGVVDHWTLLKYRKREDGSILVYPDSCATRYRDGRPVFEWTSPRYAPKRPLDSLPKFDINHVLKVYGVAVNPVRHYLHTNPVQTIRPDYDHLRDYDSDEDTAWQDQYEHEKIHDFIDCNPQEKQFMCLWNAFTRRISPIFSLRMKEVLCRFVVQHAMEVQVAEAYPALCAQLSMFRRDGIITRADSLEVVKRYRSTLACQSQSPTTYDVGHTRKDSVAVLVAMGGSEVSP